MHKEQISLLMKLGGRNAIPVRAIPYVTGWRLSPREIAGQLAGIEEYTDPDLKHAIAYQLRFGSFVELKPSDWLEIFGRVEKLDEKPISPGGQWAWRNRALSKRPPGVFVWAHDVFTWNDEIEKKWIDDFMPKLEPQDLEIFNRGGLTHAADLSQEMIAVIFEKFGVHQEAPKLSDDLRSLVAELGERADNGKAIDWQHWVVQSPSLTAKEASRLLCGLDPDVFESLDCQASSKISTGVLESARNIQRLAEKFGMSSASPADWLTWADSFDRPLPVHDGFREKVEECISTITDATCADRKRDDFWWQKDYEIEEFALNIAAGWREKNENINRDGSVSERAIAREIAQRIESGEREKFRRKEIEKIRTIGEDRIRRVFKGPY